MLKLNTTWKNRMLDFHSSEIKTKVWVEIEINL